MDNEKILSKEVFEVHFAYTKEALNELRKTTSLIFHKIDQHQTTLAANTISLDEHKKRSLHIEKRQDIVIESLHELRNSIAIISTKLGTIEDDMHSFEKEIKPIKEHVNNVTSVFKVVDKMLIHKDLIFKSLLFLFLAISIYYGNDFSKLIRGWFK
jgi:chromosome segregation ATPase